MLVLKLLISPILRQILVPQKLGVYVPLVISHVLKWMVVKTMPYMEGEYVCVVWFCVFAPDFVLSAFGYKAFSYSTGIY